MGIYLVLIDLNQLEKPAKNYGKQRYRKGYSK